jgi:hypothetical protein
MKLGSAGRSLLTLSQARAKGNEPSKGAKIDKEIEEEEAEMLKKKGNFGPKTSN